MSTAKSLTTKIPNAPPDPLAAATEAPVVEDRYAGAAKNLDRRNVIAKTPWQPVQPIAFPHAKAVTLELRVLEEASSGTREGTLVPGRVPVRVVAIDPWVLCACEKSATKKAKHK